MAAQTDIQILLTYYNNQIQLNTSEGNECAATLAAQINNILQSKLDQPPSVQLRKDMLALAQTTEDHQVLSKQSKYSTLLWLVAVLILLMIIIFLLDFK
jgi:hypothetical protein